MGRTVADCAAMLQVIAGYDSKDVLSSRRVVPDYTAGIQRGLKGNRIGVIQELMDDDNLDAEIKAAMVTAIKALIGLGAKVDEVSIPHIKASMYPIGIIIWCEQSALQRKLYESRRHLFTQYARVHHVVGSLLPSKAYVMARQTQNLIRSQVLETFQKYDLLLCPSAPKLPPKIEDASRAAKFPAKDALLLRHADGHLGFAPLAGCPAISVPCGFSQSGLPIGLQITGRPFEEDTVLRVAHAYEQSTDWHNRHPEL
jgi:aspartyl-tRNA(Asn)/glutamyl-tRNA(Gln) amidotransferase subunit A